MTTALGLIAVTILGQVFMLLGLWFVGFPLAFLLAWTSMGFRTTVCGFISGLAGAALAYYASFLLFSRIGDGTYHLWALVATSFGVLIPVYNDYKRTQHVEMERQLLLKNLEATQGAEERQSLAAATDMGGFSSVYGGLAGVVGAVVWFLQRS